MISVLFATFTLIVTDYGVPVMVGGKYNTLPMMMYTEVIGRLDFSKGSVIGMVLLVPAVVAFVFDFISRDTRSSGFVNKFFTLKKSIGREIFAYSFLTVVSIAILYPIITFAGLTFNKNYPSDLTFTMDNIMSTLNKGAGGYLLNSIVIAVAVSLVGTALAFFLCLSHRACGGFFQRFCT